MLCKLCNHITTKKINPDYECNFNPIIVYNLTNDKSCSICWKESYKDNIEFIFPFNCTHFICYDCFKKWYKVYRKKSLKKTSQMSCPLCRKKILKDVYNNIKNKNSLKKSSVKIKDFQIIIWY